MEKYLPLSGGSRGRKILAAQLTLSPSPSKGIKARYSRKRSRINKEKGDTQLRLLGD